MQTLLIGYESGFPPAAGGKKNSASLAAGVASAEHVPVPAVKVRTVQEAVLLLLDGHPVQSLQRGGLSFVPVQITDGAAADSFEVLMEASTLLYRTNAEALARKELQIRDTSQRITDAEATLAELQEALGRSKTALKQAVKAAGDGDAELSDIGAMAVE